MSLLGFQNPKIQRQKMADAVGKKDYPIDITLVRSDVEKILLGDEEHPKGMFNPNTGLFEIHNTVIVIDSEAFKDCKEIYEVVMAPQ